jgi:hypothetical protein
MWLSHLRKILLDQMALSDDQVIIGNFNNIIHKTAGLVIVLHSLSKKPFANSNRSVMVDGNLVQSQYILFSESVTATIFAYNKTDGTNEAYERNHEILLALTSHFAEKMQLQGGFRLATVPPDGIIDASGVEGGSNIFRFDIRLKAITGYKTQQPASYFKKTNIQTTYE